MPQINQQALAAQLAAIGWTRERMERRIGHSLTGDVPEGVKRLCWEIIKSREIRQLVTMLEASFPEMVLTSVTKAGSVGLTARDYGNEKASHDDDIAAG